MTLFEIAAIGELAAAMAVVATLVFLTLQLRMNNNTTRGEMELEAARMFTEWHARVSASAVKRNLWNRGSTNEELSREEASEYIWMMAELIFFVEGVFRQYQRGLISDGSFRPLLETIVVAKRDNQYMQIWWAERAGPVSDEFRAFLDSDHHLLKTDWRFSTPEQFLDREHG
jgi:hypothetical protein